MNAVLTALEPFIKQIKSASIYFEDAREGSAFPVGQPMARIHIEWFGTTPREFTTKEFEDNDAIRATSKESDTYYHIKLENISAMKEIIEFFSTSMKKHCSYPPLWSFSYQFY